MLGFPKLCVIYAWLFLASLFLFNAGAAQAGSVALTQEEQGRPAEQSAEKATIQLKWKHAFQFAGFYAAREKGFYDEAGLEVSIIEGGPGIDFIDAVLSGKAQYGVEMPNLLLRRAKGDPVVVLASIFQYSPISLISLAKKNIRTPQDLIGRNIMFRNEVALRAMISKAGVDLAAINIIPHSFDLEDLIQGKTDAMSLYVTDTPAEFEKRGLAFNAMTPRDYGVKFYGDSLFTTEDQITKHPGQVEAFRKASLKGWEYAMENPEEIARIIHQKYAPHKSIEHLISVAEQMKALLLHEIIEIGHMNPLRWKHITETFVDQGMLPADFSLEGFIYEPPLKDKRVIQQTEEERVWVQLTPEERSWLDTHPVISMCVDPNWMPFEQINEEGVYEGLIADYMSLISGRVGIPFELSPTKTFKGSMTELSTGNCSIISAWVHTKEDKRQGRATKPYFTSPRVFVVHKDAPFAFGLQDIIDRRISVVESYPIRQELLEMYPDINLVLVENQDEGVRKVAMGEADAFVSAMAGVIHSIRKQSLSNVKIGGSIPGDVLISILVNENETALIPILDKAIDSLTTEDRKQIRDKWTSVTFEHGFDYTLMWKVVFGFLVLLAVFLAWNLVIRRQKAVLAEAKQAAEAASQAKSTFLANMSHELRTPLNAILGFSEMLTRDSDSLTEQKAKLRIIKRSGEHLLAMINDTLDLSKIEAGKIELEAEGFDLLLMLQNIGEMIAVRAAAKDLTFELEIAKHISPHVEGDLGKIRQILINLLGNAVKFTEDGGIVLRARTSDMVDGRICLHLEFIDSGPGIPDDQIDTIFKPFAQAGRSALKHKGTGLGLAITKSFVDLMDGAIAVENKPEGGCRFTVEVPLKTAEVDTIITPAPRSVVGLVPGQPHWRVLIVDDDLENRLLLSAQLTAVGFEVREAEDGEQAVTAFEKWRPHYIWMDMRMPVMDGYEATAKIRTLPGGGEVRIVALTASAFKEQEDKILAAGCNGVLHKPYQEHDLFDMMARHLDVEFTYDEAARSVPPLSPLRPEDVVNLPSEIVERMLKAAQQCDQDTMQNLIDQLPDDQLNVIHGLQHLVSEFEWEKLADILKSPQV